MRSRGKAVSCGAGGDCTQCGQGADEDCRTHSGRSWQREAKADSFARGETMGCREYEQPGVAADEDSEASSGLVTKGTEPRQSSTGAAQEPHSCSRTQLAVRHGH